MQAQRAEYDDQSIECRALADEYRAEGKHVQAQAMTAASVRYRCRVISADVELIGLRADVAVIAAGLDRQDRVQQTRLLAWEDAAGTCNTRPGELDSAESCQQRDPDRGTPPPVPWRTLGAGLLVIFVALAGVHLGAAVFKPATQVAAR